MLCHETRLKTSICADRTLCDRHGWPIDGLYDDELRVHLSRYRGVHTR